MKKLIILLTLTLSTMAVYANPANTAILLTEEAIALEAEFAKLKQLYAEEADETRMRVGGLIAFRKVCDVEWSDFGRRSVGLVMEDNGSENYYVAEGFSTISAKIDKFGCTLAKSVVKHDETGVLFFNFQ